MVDWLQDQGEWSWGAGRRIGKVRGSPSSRLQMWRVASRTTLPPHDQHSHLYCLPVTRSQWIRVGHYWDWADPEETAEATKSGESAAAASEPVESTQGEAEANEAKDEL